MTVSINWPDRRPKAQTQKLGSQNERKWNTVNIFSEPGNTWNIFILIEKLQNVLNSGNLWPCLPLHLIAYYLSHISCLRRPKLPYSTWFHKFTFPLVPLLSIPSSHTHIAHLISPNQSAFNTHCRCHLPGSQFPPTVFPCALVTVQLSTYPLSLNHQSTWLPAPHWAASSKC